MWGEGGRARVTVCALIRVRVRACLHDWRQVCNACWTAHVDLAAAEHGDHDLRSRQLCAILADAPQL